MESLKKLMQKKSELKNLLMVKPETRNPQQ